MRYFIAVLISLAGASGALAQGNYEVQVYGSELTAKGVTMVELHSNITAKGSKDVVDGVLPTNHAVHETVEITHGFNEWFETGFYQFTSIQPDGSWKWVGTHIRPRMAIPEKYHLPVGLSLSTEFGYQRPNFDADTWTWEIRPIVDKQIGKEVPPDALHAISLLEESRPVKLRPDPGLGIGARSDGDFDQAQFLRRHESGLDLG